MVSYPVWRVSMSFVTMRRASARVQMAVGLTVVSNSTDATGAFGLAVVGCFRLDEDGRANFLVVQRLSTEGIQFASKRTLDRGRTFELKSHAGFLIVHVQFGASIAKGKVGVKRKAIVITSVVEEAVKVEVIEHIAAVQVCKVQIAELIVLKCAKRTGIHVWHLLHLRSARRLVVRVLLCWRWLAVL